MKKELAAQEKLDYAKDLGISLQGLYSSNGLLDEPELDRRIFEAERARREDRLWVLAVISAAASAISALAAWLAVLHECR